MIETIVAVVCGGLAVTTFFMSRKKKEPDVFTIKSDRTNVIESNIPGNPSSKPPFPHPQPPERFKMQRTDTVSKQPINMADISGIRLEGSGNISLNHGKLYINDDSEVYVKSKTLWVKTLGISGSIYFSSQNYDTITNVEVPLVNFNSSIIDRVSLNGSGEIDISNTVMSDTLDVLLKGSGDIALNNVITKELELNVKGSGDIKIDKKCRANNTTAILQGSGDIIIKSIMVGTISKKLKGSGGITIPNQMSSTKKEKPFFNRSVKDGRPTTAFNVAVPYCTTIDE